MNVESPRSGGFQPSTVVVTGGAGFIGGTLVRWLLANNPDVRVVTYDALTYAGNLDSLAEVFSTHGAQGDGRHYFVKADIRDAATLASVLNGRGQETGTHRAVPRADAIVHLAAESHVDRSILGPAEFISTNVVGTQVVLESAGVAAVNGHSAGQRRHERGERLQRAGLCSGRDQERRVGAGGGFRNSLRRCNHAATI